MCERCKDPDKTDITTYKIHKGNASRATTLCDECAKITRNAGFKLIGGRAPEVETPRAPEPEEAAAEERTSEPEPESTQDEPPARPSRRR